MPLRNEVKIRDSENELIELQGITNLRTVILGQKLSKSGFMEVAREEMEVAGAKIQRCVSGAL